MEDNENAFASACFKSRYFVTRYKTASSLPIFNVNNKQRPKPKCGQSPGNMTKLKEKIWY